MPDSPRRAWVCVWRVWAWRRRPRPTGDTDHDFVRLMLPYQQSSMDMAKAEVQYGRDPELKAMAQTIVDDQGRRIALMKAWEDKHPK